MSAKTLSKVYRVSHLFGFSAVFFMFIWMKYDGKSFGTTDQLKFNLHPVCMALGLLFLNGEAVMAFRSLRAYPRHLVKLLHALLHGTVVLVMIAGIKAVRDSHDYNLDKEGKLSPLPSSQSLHAWLGSTIAIVYFLQFIGSLFLFYFPLTPGSVRATALPYHRLSGIFSFVFAASIVALGVLERRSWGLDCNDSSTVCLENWIINFFAGSVFLYISCVTLIVLNPSWSTKIPLSKLAEQKKVL